MKLQRKTLMEVGLFVSLGLGVAFLSIFFIGRERGMFARTYQLVAPFKDISGLRDGAPVQLSGLRVGFVEGVRLPQVENGALEVVLKIATNYKEYIRQNSKASIQTQGLLGDKYILISRGTAEAPVLEEGGILLTAGVGGLAALTAQGQEMMEQITEAAKKIQGTFGALSEDEQGNMKGTLDNLHEASASLRDILADVRDGKGTVGALLKDPALYNDLRAVFGRANRSRMVKSLVRSAIEEPATSEK